MGNEIIGDDDLNVIVSDLKKSNLAFQLSIRVSLLRARFHQFELISEFKDLVL
jgi:hypothetical protein